jgi:hypothetical protein
VKFGSGLQANVWVRFAACLCTNAMAIRIPESSRDDDAHRAGKIGEMADALLAEYNKRAPSVREQREAQSQGKSSDTTE